MQAIWGPVAGAAIKSARKAGRTKLKPISQEEAATVLWYDKPAAKWVAARAGKNNQLPGGEEGVGWDAFSTGAVPRPVESRGGSAMMIDRDESASGKGLLLPGPGSSGSE